MKYVIFKYGFPFENMFSHYIIDMSFNSQHL